MITPFQLYLLTRLDAICSIVDVLGCMSIIVVSILIGFYIGGIIEGEEELTLLGVFKNIPKCLRTPLLIGTLLVIVAKGCIPSTKEMAAIIIVPKIVNSEKGQGLNTKIYDLAVEWMEELRPQNLTNQKADNPQSRKKGD